MLTYSNPRKSYTTDQWPYGSMRTTATFTIEANKRGQRVSRVTINPKNGRTNKPKTTTYSMKACIVDGSDGRTYIAELTMYGHITIMESNLQYQQAVFHTNDENYPEILNLFKD